MSTHKQREEGLKSFLDTKRGNNQNFNLENRYGPLIETIPVSEFPMIVNALDKKVAL